MHALTSRIANAGTNQTRAESNYLALPPGTLQEMPLALVKYLPVGVYPWGETGTLAYTEVTPMWAADSGGIIAATTPGPWGHVYAAGRP